jgi:hypothetical protein
MMGFTLVNTDETFVMNCRKSHFAKTGFLDFDLLGI